MPSGEPFDSDDADGAVGAIDYDVLERIGQRLAGTRRFTDVTLRPEYAPDSVVAEYDVGYFPSRVERAYLRIRWYDTDDFNVHYSEQCRDGSSWECRWDRHPNEHDAREHFHPPPDAETPGRDAEHPRDWRDVLSEVLETLDERIRAFWV
ncbi:hypothetical protein [Halomarina pelagica]|uniref:hypothetical protein n=1 Tax=Halomarina pelagica TaxID=2961599 RepID=UPI0020C27CC9|nr:hypothetical protein [Halomarina sp. BND7]